MVPFLKDFLENLNAVQSKQILRLLNQMRDRGEIRNSLEFESKLADLASLIKKGELTQRTPVLVYQNGDLLESDAIRTFIENVRLDLEAGLGETERLSTAMHSHNRILTENYFDSIEAGLAELEAETRAYEVLESQKFTGFTKLVKRMNFGAEISTPGADDNDPNTSSLFEDSRGGETLIYSPPGKGEVGIRLGTRKGTVVKFNMFNRVEVLTDATTPQTALDTSTADNTPIKAIDGSLDTAWKHSVLLNEDPDSVRLIFAPSFIGARRINALVIHPLSDVAMKLFSVSYIDSGGQEVSLDLGTTTVGQADVLFERSSLRGSRHSRYKDWILPNVRRVIPVGDIIARKIIFTFQQDTGSDGDFFYFDNDLGSWRKGTPIEDFLEGGFGETSESVVEDGIFGETSESVVEKIFGETSESIVEDGPIDAYLSDDPTLVYVNTDEEIPVGETSEQPPSYRQARFHEYVFGLKDLSVIEREYGSNGFFVPESFEMNKAPNILALYTDADYPIGYLSDIEFLLVKKNYDSSGGFLDAESLPMLPFGTSSVNERLFLTDRQVATSGNDTGVLRFYPDFTESLIVYKEGTSLTIGTDYTVSVDGGTFSSVVPPAGTISDPPECRIRIVAPQSGVFYAISYTPLLSSSTAGSEVWLNQNHSVRLGRYQTYVFNNQRESGSVSSCIMGLQIIIRANTLNTRVSPYLREAVLLGD